MATFPHACTMASANLHAIDPFKDRRWKELVEAHPASSVFHSLEWLNALQSAYGYEPVVYTNCEPSEPLTAGLVFCKISSWLTGRRLVSLPFSDHCEPLVENPSQLDDLLRRVREVVNAEKWKYCEVRPLHSKTIVPSAFAVSNQYFWHAVDLRPSLDVIFKRLHNSVQRNIRRAEREALTYEEGNSEQLLSQFYELVVETRRRQHLPPQPMQWFRSLIESFGTKLKIRMAFKNHVAIASILTLSHHRTVTYKYGASDAIMHRLGGVTLLFWNTIQQAKAAGFESMDLGRSDVNNEGLAVFKEHWGGVRSVLSYWRYPGRPPARENATKQDIIRRIVKVAPDRALIAVGNLLYRHIG
jgi:CelD/BcsL family acetyltransferase involved in cellulose biosynthesis